ncbi:hypothetical protein pb186bvf_006081 [Paramecium bursaria]
MEKDITKGFRDEEQKDSQQSKEIKLEIFVYEGFLENFKGYKEQMQEKILGMKIIPELTRVELSHNLPKQAQKSVLNGRQASKGVDKNFLKEIDLYNKAQQVVIVKPEIIELSKPLNTFKNINRIKILITLKQNGKKSNIRLI